jgi:hypothetical protein
MIHISPVIEATQWRRFIALVSGFSLLTKHVPIRKARFYLTIISIGRTHQGFLLVPRRNDMYMFGFPQVISGRGMGTLRFGNLGLKYPE